MFSNIIVIWVEVEVFCLYNVIGWIKEVNQFINYFDFKKKRSNGN